MKKLAATWARELREKKEKEQLMKYLGEKRGKDTVHGDDLHSDDFMDSSDEDMSEEILRRIVKKKRSKN